MLFENPPQRSCQCEIVHAGAFVILVFIAATVVQLRRISAMSEDAVRFRRLAEECRDQAAKARSSIDEEAWLKLAEEWLALAHVNEQRQLRT
jgi:hypothetical protein